jgi:cyclophilin family peptidyl-prolyl cis-trans isomerase
MPKSRQPRRIKRKGRSPRGVADWSGSSKKHGPFGIFSNIKLFYFIGAILMIGSLFSGALVTQCNTNNNSTQTTATATPSGTEEATPTPAESPTPTITVEAVKQWSAPPAMSIDPAKHYTAKIRTDKGEIDVDLYAADAPNTVNNFVFLAREGFYDELPFYYVNTDLYATTGDPAGNGKGGPGYNIDREASTKTFEVGTLGMINGSQFFILLNPSQVDTGNYWPFGRVTTGLDIVQGLAQSDQVLGIDIVEQ